MILLKLVFYLLHNPDLKKSDYYEECEERKTIVEGLTDIIFQMDYKDKEYVREIAVELTESNLYNEQVSHAGYKEEFEKPTIRCFRRFGPTENFTTGVHVLQNDSQ